MKIRNDLVSIKIGNKHYDFNNLILNEYLRTFVESQLSIQNANLTNNRKTLNCLLIKFDTPLQNLNEERVLVNEDFDVYAFSKNTAIQEISDNRITAQYKYETDKVLSYSSSDFSEQIDISEFYGKKITALGFNSFGAKSTSVYTNVKAVLDTSNYNLYLQENQGFTVTRKDIITTDALFYSNDKNKVPAPLHLMPINNKAVIEGGNTSFSILYSIGLSSYIDRIDKEYIIGDDIQVQQNGLELSFEGLENILNKTFYYPNTDIYPSNDLYPTKSDYTYVIIKYKVYQNILNEASATDTGYFYHQAIPIKLLGDLNLKIKYERG